MAVLAGCSHYRGGTGSGFVAGTLSGSSIIAKPTMVEETVMLPAAPEQYRARDSEEVGPRPALDATRNWGRDILPLKPNFHRDHAGVIRL